MWRNIIPVDGCDHGWRDAHHYDDPGFNYPAGFYQGRLITEARAAMIAQNLDPKGAFQGRYTYDIPDFDGGGDSGRLSGKERS